MSFIEVLSPNLIIFTPLIICAGRRNCKAILSLYDWEYAPDTTTSWRVGDGTAAFYNYVNYIMAGFTEHDTFRSNQIREGQISRDEALSLVEIEIV